MKLRITETFEIADVVVDAIIKKNSLHVEGTARRDAIRDFFTAQISSVISESSVGLEDEIAKFNERKGQALSTALTRAAKSQGVSLEDLIAQLVAKKAEADERAAAAAATADLDSDDDSEDNDSEEDEEPEEEF